MKLSKKSAIYVAGHNGMVGSAIVRKLQNMGFENIITRSRRELDLCRQADVEAFFSANRIDYVVVAAAKVGGIHANNSLPADFLYENLMIEANIIHSAYKSGISQLLFLGSSCIYPRLATQPMREDALLTGTLESTNEPYAIAKIAGIKLCESYNRQWGTDYRSIMPTNLYGQNDNFDLESSHVIPALIRKIHGAKTTAQHEVEIWGSGRPRREFMHVDDLADACFFVMNLNKEEFWRGASPMSSHLNAGTGKDITIEELALLIMDVVGYRGKIKWNAEKPDGTPRKLMDTTKMNSLGWSSTIALHEGLKQTYKWYCDRISQ